MPRPGRHGGGGHGGGGGGGGGKWAQGATGKWAQGAVGHRKTDAAGAAAAPPDYTAMIQSLFDQFSSQMTADQQAALQALQDQMTAFQGSMTGSAADAAAQLAAQTQAKQQDLLGSLTGFLKEYDLPSSLLAFIKDEVSANKPSSEIINDLRMTPEYKATFPENDKRLQNGLSWMPESQIRTYRDEAKRLAREYLGVAATDGEIANLIERGTSLQTWENRLNVEKQVQKWGPAVQQAFAEETGSTLSDQRLHEFMSPDYSTPELDQLYNRALMRGQPASLGMGIRPEDETKLLESLGLSPEQAFAGYQQAASELPTATRLAAISGYLDQNAEKYPDAATAVAGSPFSLLVRAGLMQDPAARAQLQQLMSLEVARWQGGGGAARSGLRAVGLLSPNQQ
jgi:hypothetical protein